VARDDRRRVLIRKLYGWPQTFSMGARPPHSLRVGGERNAV
jgi:hypothetical protein